MSCNTSCKLCPRLIISTGVSIVSDTLVVDIPTGAYPNHGKFCLVIAQNIPTTATINMPVAISIGGETTTLYPMVRCDCSQVTACAVRTRTRYPLCVATNATSAVFKVLRNLSCAPDNRLAAVPAPTPTPAPTTGA